ncbi:hypothetical protein [Klebsiella pneumoniae]|nr:hypothetical protein [Klebsiella pneumoniae]
MEAATPHPFLQPFSDLSAFALSRYRESVHWPAAELAGAATE